MENQKRKISLGFTAQQFEPGVHICQIFSDDDERNDLLVNYIISGIHADENTACFSEKETKSTLTGILEENGISYDDVEKQKRFSLAKTSEVYFEGAKFEPERMLILLQEFYENSLRMNRSGARVIGEMTPDIEHIQGGSRLLEYESKVSLLLKKYPVSSVCQYDARSFDGSTIMDILKVHPYMIVKGAVVHNPFFIHPEEYLSENCCSE